jgi:hypothetical protein
MIYLRKHEPGDIDFIYSSWLQSYRDGNEGMSDLPMSQYYGLARHWIDLMLKSRPHQISIACNEEYPEQIFGYLVREKSPTAHIIHYAYVKQIYRRLGILNALMNSIEPAGLPFYYTHKTKLGTEIGRNWFIGSKRHVRYYPYTLYYPFEPSASEGTEIEEDKTERLTSRHRS